MTERGRAVSYAIAPLLAVVLAAAGCASAPAPSATDAFAQAGMVDIRTLVPDMSLDMRYAGPNNFVGTRIDGYGAPRCYLHEPAAQALQRVEQALRKEGLRLRLFDCYRPARAVAQFVRWAGDLQDQRGKATYYPNLDKTALLGDYIAPVSGHSRGATVDLTLLDCRTGQEACVPLDMGTEFDFFDARANTDSPLATPSQRDNRQRLLQAMAREGFSNYPQEWWHYSLAAAGAQPVHDLPIE